MILTNVIKNLFLVKGLTLHKETVVRRYFKVLLKVSLRFVIFNEIAIWRSLNLLRQKPIQIFALKFLKRAVAHFMSI